MNSLPFPFAFFAEGILVVLVRLVVAVVVEVIIVAEVVKLLVQSVIIQSSAEVVEVAYILKHSAEGVLFLVFVAAELLVVGDIVMVDKIESSLSSTSRTARGVGFETPLREFINMQHRISTVFPSPISSAKMPPGRGEVLFGLFFTKLEEQKERNK